MNENEEVEYKIVMNLLGAIQDVRQGYYSLASIRLETIIEQLKNKPSVLRNIAEEINKELEELD